MIFFSHQSPLCKKCPFSELFWSVFSCIRTEYGEIQSISLYSGRARENAYQNNSEYGHLLRSDNVSLFANYMQDICKIGTRLRSVFCRDFESVRTKCTAWKVSKYGLFSDPYFPVFNLNTENYRVNTDKKKIRTSKRGLFCWHKRFDSTKQLLSCYDTKSDHNQQ